MTRATWKIGPYTVTSWGNGLAYTIAAPDGREVYLQGDDASDWRAEYDAADDSDAGSEAFLGRTLEDYADPADARPAPGSQQWAETYRDDIGESFD